MALLRRSLEHRQLATVFWIMVLVSRVDAQDMPKIMRGDYWFPAVREVPFLRAEFPIVMLTDAESRTGSYISIPLQRIEDKKGCSIKIKVVVEEWESLPPPDPKNRYDVNARKRNAFLTMQDTKTGIPSGFGVSSRKFPQGRVSDASLTYRSKPPEKFYFTLHVPYWTKKLTIVGLEVQGLRIIEPLPEIRDEQTTKILQWIQDLGADDYRIRSSAHTSLVDMGSGALPQLRPFLKDADPERRLRVIGICAEIERQEAERLPPVKMAK